MQVLLVSWEYPPVIEGGLARHVLKLSEHWRVEAPRCTC
jgi:glycogen(starch) synthase